MVQGGDGGGAGRRRLILRAAGWAGVFLYTLYVGKDKQGDGWAPLKSHIMFTDPMLEANVNKTGP